MTQARDTSSAHSSGTHIARVTMTSIQHLKLAPFLAALVSSACSPLPTTLDDGAIHATEQVAVVTPIRLSKSSKPDQTGKNRPTKAPSSRQVASIVKLLREHMDTLGSTDEPKQVLAQIDQLEKDLSRIRAAAWKAVERGESLHVDLENGRGASNFTQILLGTF
jgi:hypothetical protein